MKRLKIVVASSTSRRTEIDAKKDAVTVTASRWPLLKKTVGNFKHLEPGDCGGQVVQGC
jgi:hypothetical protein